MESQSNDVVAQSGQEAVAKLVSEYCVNDGSRLVEGEKFGYPAWVCQSCTYWKLRTT